MILVHIVSVVLLRTHYNYPWKKFYSEECNNPKSVVSTKYYNTKMVIMAQLGHFWGLPWAPLKSPKPPYPLKLLSHGTSQTYDSLKAFAFLEVWNPENGCPFQPILPWADGKTLQLCRSCVSSSFQVLFEQVGHWRSNLDFCKCKLHLDGIFIFGITLISNIILTCDISNYCLCFAFQNDHLDVGYYLCFHSIASTRGWSALTKFKYVTSFVDVRMY